jgi:hypothetical protein
MFMLVGGRAELLLILRSRGAAGALDTSAVGSCRRLFGCSARKRTGCSRGVCAAAATTLAANARKGLIVRIFLLCIDRESQ